MIFWLIAASLTGLITVWVVTPLMREKANHTGGWLLVAGLPALALVIYGCVGTPALTAY